MAEPMTGLPDEKKTYEQDIERDDLSVGKGDLLSQEHVDPVINAKMHLVNDVRISSVAMGSFTNLENCRRPLTKSASHPTTQSSSASMDSGMKIFENRHWPQNSYFSAMLPTPCSSSFRASSPPRRGTNSTLALTMASQWQSTLVCLWALYSGAFQQTSLAADLLSTCRS